MRTNFSQRAIVGQDAPALRRHRAQHLGRPRSRRGSTAGVMSEKALGRELRVQFTPTLLFLDEKGSGGAAPERLPAAAPLRSSARLRRRARRARACATTSTSRRRSKEAASATLHDESRSSRRRRSRCGAPSRSALLFETPYCAGCDEAAPRRPAAGRECADCCERFTVYRLTLDDKRDAQTTWARCAARRLHAHAIVLFDGGRRYSASTSYVRPFHLACGARLRGERQLPPRASFQRYLQARGERLRGRGEAVELWK